MPDFSQKIKAEIEDDPEIIRDFYKNSEPNQAALAMIAPYEPEQISPTRSRFAEISFSEELKMENAIKKLISKDVEEIHFMINSLGGGVSSSFKIAQCLINNFDYIKVYIPHYAVSGGTLISLVGDKIIMGGMSNISPIDPQTVRDGKRNSVNSLPRILRRLEDFFSDTAARDAPYPWKALADKIDPVELQEHIDSSSMMINHARNILCEHEDISEEDMEVIIRKLTSGYPTHQYAITFSEAKDIFGDRLENGEDNPMMDVMKRWLEKYIAKASSDHHILYIPPNEGNEEERTGE